MKLWTALAASVIAYPAQAQSDLQNGFAGALRGCETWVLTPSSWATGSAPFLKTVGLGDKIGLVESVSEASLPPQQLRVANHYWRINSTADAGYVLVVSDRIPMCHITGGGATDLQPIVEALLASSEFQSRWQKMKDNSQGDMISTAYKNRQEPAFSIVISRAKKPTQRLDRVQVLATATFETSK
ncbi:MAG: hypothetical protein ABIO26_04550 [Croceibacterium sp.]